MTRASPVNRAHMNSPLVIILGNNKLVNNYAYEALTRTTCRDAGRSIIGGAHIYSYIRVLPN